MNFRFSSHKRLWIVLAGVVVALAAFRLLLPPAGLAAANYGLGKLENYVGNIGSVHVALGRGEFRFNDFELRRRAGRGPAFIEAAHVTVDVRLSGLLFGKRIVDVYVEKPGITLIWSEDPSNRQLGERLRWAEFFNRLPVEVDTISVDGGMVSLRNLGGVDSRIDIEDLEVAMLGMATPTSGDDPADKPQGNAQFEYSGIVVGAPLTGRGRFSSDLSDFYFVLDTELADLPLTAANPWTEALVSLDSEKGTLRSVGNLEYAEGRLHGEADVTLTGASFIENGSKEGGPFARFWERLANFGLRLFKDENDNLRRTLVTNAVIDMPPEPDLRQIVLTLIAGAIEGVGHSADDPVRVAPPEGSQ